MRPTERDAKRLMSDPSSWSQGGIRRRAFRQMQLTPDEEVPRGRPKRRGHEHDWAESGETVAWRGAMQAMYVCRRCGNRGTSRWR